MHGGVLLEVSWSFYGENALWSDGDILLQYPEWPLGQIGSKALNTSIVYLLAVFFLPAFVLHINTFLCPLTPPTFIYHLPTVEQECNKIISHNMLTFDS